MATWQDVAMATVELAGNLAILAAGLTIIREGSRAPDRNSMPPIFSDSDIEQVKGIVRTRQVLLHLGGAVVIWVAIARLA